MDKLIAYPFFAANLMFNKIEAALKLQSINLMQ